MAGKYKAKLLKNNKEIKLMFNVDSIKTDKKYGYFVVTTKIYKHQIMTTHSFKEVDTIELYEVGIKTPVQVITKE